MHKGKEVKQKIDETLNNLSSKKIFSKLKNQKKLKFRLYVYRFLSSGELANAKPCAECTRWIYTASTIGLHYEVFYTNDEGKLETFDGDNCTHYIPKHTYFNI